MAIKKKKGQQTPEELRKLAEQPHLSEAGRAGLLRSAASEEITRQQTEAVRARQEERTRLGLREPSREELAIKERLGVHPEQMEARELERQEKARAEVGVGERTALVEELLGAQETADALTRAAQAGLIPLNIAGKAVMGLFGIEAKELTPELFDVPIAGKIAKMASAGTGKAFTLGYGGFNLANIVGLGNDISNIEGDITDLRTSTREILMEVRNGGDVFEAIEALERIEEDMRWKQGDLQVAIQMSPKDIIEGKSANHFIFNNLDTVQSRRRILERLAISGDFNQLDRAISKFTGEVE